MLLQHSVIAKPNWHEMTHECAWCVFALCAIQCMSLNQQCCDVSHVWFSHVVLILSCFVLLVNRAARTLVIYDWLHPWDEWSDLIWTEFKLMKGHVKAEGLCLHCKGLKCPTWNVLHWLYLFTSRQGFKNLIRSFIFLLYRFSFHLSLLLYLVIT